ncbi:Dyp-type peroxidase family [Ceratobasidium sp. AG-Ba]|nr:Dyp-type peroxidase family [Ceratobasidium sp. AG-Ba]QRW04537.1 Dyp-type peroxidase family [Ceratobasidium sp. AG-Ba]
MSQAPLPPTTPAIDVENIQGDIVIGLPKKKEEFVFFVIKNAEQFKKALPRLKIATTGDVQRALKAIDEGRKQRPGELVHLPFLNIAFSQQGLNALGIKDNIGDTAFTHGQLADAETLGDQGTQTDTGFDPKWQTAFKHRIDGVLLAAGESWKTVNDVVKEALEILGHSIQVVYSLKGSVRPGEEKGHEHFGWEDGISNPAIKSVVDPLPGQRVIPPGVLLLGTEEDPGQNRPAWAVEGSFLAFRQLSQLVPEFHDFLDKNPIVLPGLDPKKGSELLGARLVGRWKSGAPIQLAPLADNPELAKDKQRNNHFVYPTEGGDEGQTACPYSAHIRKTNPRNDLQETDTDNTSPSNPVTGLSITRAGIPYGPEVTHAEQWEKLTEHERGLAFVSYQSALLIGADDNVFNSKGFRFIQRSWANNVDFPPNKGFPAGKGPGFDPIIGQDNGQPRGTLGNNEGPQLKMPRDFVVSRGGEYFFSPSIHALKTTFAGVAP